MRLDRDTGAQTVLLAHRLLVLEAQVEQYVLDIGVLLPAAVHHIGSVVGRKVVGDGTGKTTVQIVDVETGAQLRLLVVTAVQDVESVAPEELRHAAVAFVFRLHLAARIDGAGHDRLVVDICHRHHAQRRLPPFGQRESDSEIAHIAVGVELRAAVASQRGHIYRQTHIEHQRFLANSRIRRRIEGIDHIHRRARGGDTTNHRRRRHIVRHIVEADAILRIGRVETILCQRLRQCQRRHNEQHYALFIRIFIIKHHCFSA